MRTEAGEVDVLSLLGVVFVALKLAGIIGWSWWWVTLPFWGQVVVNAMVLAWVSGWMSRRRSQANRRK